MDSRSSFARGAQDQSAGDGVEKAGHRESLFLDHHIFKRAEIFTVRGCIQKLDHGFASPTNLLPIDQLRHDRVRKHMMVPLNTDEPESKLFNKMNHIMKRGIAECILGSAFEGVFQDTLWHSTSRP